ncbi:hypothetical protein O0I10_000210 [Lichtheimia ornata]|uniref:Uncharacterized protein n=1 Tax=Lichtheimia ornata TaxID=688661 RepID=A0AAD7Y546_9FUNG|nr:uncharacterized protein O0I10_000210 [Lichtheimia ornata]KAJ8663935.1 hypothetical protein O0I10_000210 [Lichtheimia ornata]
MPIKYRSIAFEPSATVAGLINKRTIAKNRLDLDISRISCIWLSLYVGYLAIYLSSGSLGFAWMRLLLNVDMFSCVWLSLYVRYSPSCMSSGALGLLWMQLSLDANMFSCVWLSLYVGYSASYLSSGALGFLWMQLSLRATCLVPFGFLMDAATIGCPQGFIHMAFIANYLYFGPLEYSWMQLALLNIVLWIRETVYRASFIATCKSSLHRWIFKAKFFIGAMADGIPQLLVWIPWTYSRQVNILAYAISSRPDLFVAVHDVSL